VTANQTGRPVAVVTGGSRGVGAATAIALAGAGYDVVVNYRNKRRRAEEIAAAARASGVDAIAVEADVTEPTAVASLVERARTWRGAIDLLVLNASGGMERDLVAADPTYPMRVNRDAPLAVVDAALPLMPAGAVVVFVTSHLAHYYGRVEQYPRYEPVAESKHAGEMALLDRAPALAARGVRLAIVSGDLIADTTVPRLMERAHPGMIARRRAQVERLPTTEDMAAAILQVALDPALPSGYVAFVGEHDLAAVSSPG
jgi:NAD(P)-dependent dehydrogenase (short-subunit alcohol dehydrogenase family)